VIGFEIAIKPEVLHKVGERRPRNPQAINHAGEISTSGMPQKSGIGTFNAWSWKFRLASCGPGIERHL
jgi:hypothetical protein